MRHWAKINNNRIVTQVVVAEEDFIASGALGHPSNWVETCVEGTFRKNYAGIGYTYDLFRNAFISPKPFNSWILNEDTCRWEAPVAYPNDNEIYKWDEENLKWTLYI